MKALKKRKTKKKRSGRKNKNKKLLTKRGTGLIDKIIDKIPVELHVPKYQFCGPGTKLKKRLARGDQGINPLDSACKEHDISYSNHSDTTNRSVADKKLQKEAFKRFLSKDASIGERATALGVAAAMKIKRTLTGKGLKCCVKKKKGLTKKKKVKGKRSKKKVSKKPLRKKTVSFNSVVKNVNKAIKKSKPGNIETAIKLAVATVKNTSKGKHVKAPRTIKVPHYSGGVLPLVPIFAGLSALGSIVGSSVSIANAIDRAKKAQMELEESKRHNHVIEDVVISSKAGRGFYLHSGKHGKGFYLSQKSKNH